MDSLTKSLIKDFLPESIGGKEVTALFGGGFKPPTAGHLEVLQKAIKNNPEIDNIIIFVGSKVRDGITQDQSFKIWDEYYKQLLDKPVRIEKSVSPIGDIYRYAKDNPEDSLYWIIGSREGREDDLQDISSRSISINKYPNLNLKTIITPDGGMSGTNARKALINNNKEAFNSFLPNNVNQDEIWNILSSQPLDEGKIEDYFKDLKGKFDNFIEKLKTQSKDIQKAFGKLAHAVRTGETLTKSEKIEIGNQLKNTLKLAGFTAASILPGGFIYLLLSRIPALKSSLIPTSFLYEIINEADPKKGTGKKPKGSKRRLYTDEDPSDTVKVKFSTRQDIINTLNKTSFKSKSHARQSQIINLIHQRVRAALSRTKDPQKKAKLRSAFEYIKKRKEASKKKTERMKKQKVNEDILEKTSLVLPRGKKIYLQAESEDYDRGLIVELTKEGGYKMNYWYGNDAKIYPVEVLVDGESIKPDAKEVSMKFHPELEKENIDPKAQAKHKGKSSPFGSAYKPLNENTTYSNYIDYKQQVKDLTKHMLKKGMNIKPLPKIIFKHNDEENAKDFLGKTAYYDPNNMIIVLYTKGRHPKDVVRSYAHEMIHHIQNLEGRLKDISTTNTMEDDYLNDIEREAYTKGNMLFRNYTDGIDGEEVTSLNEKEKPYKHKHGFNKNLGKDPFGLNQYARELASLEEIIIGDKIKCDNCGWEWKIKDGGDDLYMCHKCNHDNTPQLKEGRYDTLSNQISRDIFSNWKEDYEEGDKLSTYEDTYDFPPRGIDVKAQIQFTPGSKQLKVDGGSDEARINPKTKEKLPGYLEVTFEIDPKMLPEFWEEISMNLKDVVRHEIEHITQSGDSKTKKEKFEDDSLIRALVKAKLIPQAEYFQLPKEVDANLQGMYFRAKKEKRSFGDVINTYLDAQEITPEEKEKILDLWRSRRKALSLPQF